MANQFIGPNIVVGGVQSRDMTALGTLNINNEADARTLILTGTGLVVLPLGAAPNPEEPIVGDCFTLITANAAVVGLRTQVGGLPLPLTAASTTTVAYVSGQWVVLSEVPNAPTP